jgi:predicted RNA-binding protein
MKMAIVEMLMVENKKYTGRVTCMDLDIHKHLLPFEITH